MKHHRYPKTQSLRGCIKELRKDFSLIYDDKGIVVEERSLIFPIHGTVKLHGSNFAINYDGENMWFQSRSQIVSLKNDLYGFASFCIKNKDDMKKVCDAHWMKFGGQGSVITIYGEFCGQGIQKGVAISQLSKKFFIFSVKKTIDDHEAYYEPCCESGDIINLSKYDFPLVDFDFRNPDTELLERMVEEVEGECPVAKDFGVSGTGEGIVFTFKALKKLYRFKVKGEAHKVIREKKVVQIDPEVLKNMGDFVEYSVTNARMEQALSEVFHGDSPDVKSTGDFLKWIVNDIFEEEADRVAEFKNSKQVRKLISAKAREWFLAKV